jgi:hypothetical protein
LTAGYQKDRGRQGTVSLVGSKEETGVDKYPRYRASVHLNKKLDVNGSKARTYFTTVDKVFQ